MTKDPSKGAGRKNPSTPKGDGEWLQHGARGGDGHVIKSGSSGADGGRVVLPTGPTPPGGTQKPKK